MAEMFFTCLRNYKSYLNGVSVNGVSDKLRGYSAEDFPHLTLYVERSRGEHFILFV